MTPRSSKFFFFNFLTNLKKVCRSKPWSSFSHSVIFMSSSHDTCDESDMSKEEFQERGHLWSKTCKVSYSFLIQELQDDDSETRKFTRNFRHYKQEEFETTTGASFWEQQLRKVLKTWKRSDDAVRKTQNFLLVFSITWKTKSRRRRRRRWRWDRKRVMKKSIPENRCIVLLRETEYSRILW